MQPDDGTAGTPSPIPDTGGPGGFEQQRAALRGVVAIPVTPFDASDRVDWERHGALLTRLVEAGVGAITPNGNTGEFYTLEPSEARRATENTVKQVGERAAIIVGVGLDTSTAIAAAQHAREVGAQMVMAHQPVHPYISGDGWTEYHRRIAEAVPELGIVLYVRDARITGAQIGRLGELCPNVIGIKYSVPDPVRFASVAMDSGPGRFEWVAGLAELSAPGYFALGATGFTSGLVNVVPEISLDFHRGVRGRRLRRGAENLGADQAVRGTACGRLVRGQRERGQGGDGSAGTVPRRCASAVAHAAAVGARPRRGDPGLVARAVDDMTSLEP